MCAVYSIIQMYRYYRALCIAMAGSGLDLFMSPHFNAAGALQLLGATEAGHGLVFAAMVRTWIVAAFYRWTSFVSVSVSLFVFQMDGP